MLAASCGASKNALTHPQHDSLMLLSTTRQGTSRPRTGAFSSDTGPFRSNTDPCTPNTGTFQSNTGTYQSNTGTLQSNTSTSQSNLTVRCSFQPGVSFVGGRARLLGVPPRPRPRARGGGSGAPPPARAGDSGVGWRGAAAQPPNSVRPRRIRHGAAPGWIWR